MQVLVKASHTLKLEALELLVQSLGFAAVRRSEHSGEPTIVLLDLTDTPMPYPEATFTPTLVLVSSRFFAAGLWRLGYFGWLGPEDSSQDLKAILEAIGDGV